MSADRHAGEAGPRGRTHSSSVPDDQRSRPHRSQDRREGARKCSPERRTPGRSWHSRSPVHDDEDDKLNQALKDSFPASDPPQPAQPGVTGWDVKDEEKKKAEGHSLSRMPNSTSGRPRAGLHSSSRRETSSAR